MGADVKQLTVYALKQNKHTATWVRAGVAFTNRDGSISVNLDVLPLDGKLVLMEGTPPVKEEPAVELCRDRFQGGMTRCCLAKGHEGAHQDGMCTRRWSK